MRRSRGPLVFPLVGIQLTGCAGDPDNEATTPSEAPKRIHVGEIGGLPAPVRIRSGPVLVLPRTAIAVPGRFPLGSVVDFNLPVRNDGTRPLRIAALEPG